MREADYEYTFTDIKESLDFVQVNDHQNGREYRLRVAIDDSQLRSLSNDRLSGNIADLVDIALAVYTADRLSVRKEQVPRRLHINLPVRFPEVLSSQRVIEHLQSVLYLFTSDHWTFTFVSRKSCSRRPLEWQLCLMPPVEYTTPKRVSLWSGGIDSLAGLCHYLVAEPNVQHILFGTGANTYVDNLQRKLKEAVQKQFPENRIDLIQVPICLRETVNCRGKNRSMRTRGFIFMLLGATCAYVQGQNTLYIYENGVGAINLPFRASEVGLDHARSVHPISLQRMSELVSLILGETFVFHNPFLFWTKAEMCNVFVETATTKLIWNTITCDRRHRAKVNQCGWCSSCLLRRQALAAAGITDQTQYVMTHIRQAQSHEESHLRAMLHQVESFQGALSQPDPWYHLSKKYYNLGEIVDQISEYEGLSNETVIRKLLRLYQQYTSEWCKVEHLIDLNGLVAQKFPIAT